MRRLIKCLHGLGLLCSMCFLQSCPSDTVDGPVVNSDKIEIEPVTLNIGGNEKLGSITITANCHWSIEKQVNEVDGDWLSVKPSDGTGNQTVSIEANSENPSANESRRMTLVCKSDGGIQRSITVIQTLAQEELSINPNTLLYDYSSASKEFTITCNASWTITGSQNWFTLNAYSGTGTQAIIVTVQENTSETEARSAVLTIMTKSGEHKDYVNISQEAHITSLTVSPNDGITAMAQAASYKIQITGDASWTASSNQSWATLDKSSGRGDSELTVTCGDNTTTSERVAVITLTSSRNNFSILIKQAAGSVPTLSTPEVTDVGMSDATLSSSYSSQFPVTEYGFCYGTSLNPTVNDKKVMIEGGGDYKGNMSAALANLSAVTRYYVRAYAISTVGTGYSENLEFKTVGQLPDIDDNDRPNPVKRK